VGFHEYKVGLTRVQVFYPVDPADAGTGTLISSVSSADAFSDNFRATAEALAPFLIQQLPVELYDEADVSGDGPFPLLLHSHGFSGDPIYATNHLSHSASWGFIVVAPSHASRNLGAFPAPPVGALSAVQELYDAYTRMVDWNAEEGHPFFGAVDVTKVGRRGALGRRWHHQRSPRSGLEVDTLIGQATAFPAPPDAELDQPVLLLPGERDNVIPLPGVLTSFGNQNPVKQLVVIENAGHNPSLDICQPIREQGGLVGPGAGLVAVFPPIAGLLALGEDGCIDGYLLPGLGSGLVRHAVVAQMRWVFGIDGDRDSLEEAFLRQNFRAATGDVQVVVAP
jgi:hypothetical protein